MIIASTKISIDHVAQLIARDGLDLAAARRHARRYAIELTGRDTGTGLYGVLRIIDRIEQMKKDSKCP
jgi:hypothetical protein